MKIFTALCFLLLCASGIAAESILPGGCQALAVQGDAVTINAKKNVLVFIHNLTANDLWVTHPVSDPSASAGWASRLQQDNWSALSLDKGSFTLNCIESRPGHEQQVPCEGAIAVCKWKHVKFPTEAHGKFWAAEDQSLAGLTAAVGARGYILPQ